MAEELHIDGRHPISIEAVEAVLRFCDRAEDGLLPGAAVIHVGGGPAAGRPSEVTVGLVSKWERALRRLERAPLTTVAVATGDCSGIALDVLLAADVRIATSGTRLIPSVHGGATWPGMVLYRLARQASGPVRRAALLGAPLTAADAVSSGLLDEVTDDPSAAVDAVIRQAAPVSGRELAIRRQLMHDAVHTRFEDALGAHLAAADRALRVEEQVR